MKRAVLILFVLLFTLSASSQYKQDVIVSAGGYSTAPGISISWTLGETIISSLTATDNSLFLSHGFQEKLVITAVEENLETPVTITVYPNPANDYVNIMFKEALNDEVNLMVISSQGKPVKTMIIEAATIEKQIDLQGLPAGIYYLKLTKGKLSNVYKVVKL